MLSLGDFVVQAFCPDATHRATLTSRSSSGLAKAESKFSAANKATRKFLHRLDSRCFGHGHRRKGFVVGCIATAEGLGPDENWHVHLTLRAPPGMNFWEFYDLIIKTAAKVPGFGHQVDVDEYTGPEWISYCFKTGSDSWLIECTRKAKP
ncbi:MAG: hypothetical protein EB003_13825 [Flavobacteriia bacterium]|jgi:hypothetical protein|nr:hypothetical protein [Flavobacteriia bacterium]